MDIQLSEFFAQKTTKKYKLVTSFCCEGCWNQTHNSYGSLKKQRCIWNRDLLYKLKLQIHFQNVLDTQSVLGYVGAMVLLLLIFQL
jgi:hypothetical protein